MNHRFALMMAFICSLRRASAFTSSLLKREEPRKVSSVLFLSSEAQVTPWNSPVVSERVANRRRNNNARFRQHVNPLARQYQQPTVLTDSWPHDTFTICNKPLHLDIGCGKGGFLLDMVKKTAEDCASSESSMADALPYNYLGLEIRPGVALMAKERIPVHGAVGVLDFVGCNANVDLDRIMDRYNSQSNRLLLDRVSIQFPDPHFKSQHAKRRVVTPALVNTLAKYMPEDSHVFLQSDIQSVLDDMRLRFRESAYFKDTIDSVEQYLEENPWGVPTEREISVLKKDLPVYRTILTRNGVAFVAGNNEISELDQDEE
ncbi:tRNA (guanine-N7-)-methyltransferase [Fistulifera solaris]|jgi:tRNA (guanine-N7-)-methyltransferase|uniref:tRNA (guanine(46)-N(7))-methyltransferase n=1 Tax=Fistulifera solaris TaxID=1519565 RepID=A0A1Z5JE21_FISSO|nr:tRNA (guanine-N7-)-methyltransferase [Fistulifera solaris]|eukprot:GAX12245.1 tRNA (guanine-N7-)-methyltransferase [Fistulifera solaris]